MRRVVQGKLFAYRSVVMLEIKLIVTVKTIMAACLTSGS